LTIPRSVSTTRERSRSTRASDSVAGGSTISTPRLSSLTLTAPASRSAPKSTLASIVPAATRSAFSPAMKLGSRPTSCSTSTISCMFAVAARN
jgi:hypothetical protein